MCFRLAFWIFSLSILVHVFLRWLAFIRPKVPVMAARILFVFLLTILIMFSLSPVFTIRAGICMLMPSVVVCVRNVSLFVIRILFLRFWRSMFHFVLCCIFCTAVLPVFRRISFLFLQNGEVFCNDIICIVTVWARFRAVVAMFLLLLLLFLFFLLFGLLLFLFFLFSLKIMQVVSNSSTSTTTTVLLLPPLFPTF